MYSVHLIFMLSLQIYLVTAIPKHALDSSDP